MLHKISEMYDILEHVDTIPRGVASDDVNLFIYVQPHDVLQRGLLVWHQRSAAASAGRDLQIDQVNVNWVGPVAAKISKSPLLHCTALWLGKNALSETIRPCNTVDLPLPPALKLVVVINWSVGRWKRNLA
jgi:hypothetical protein